MFSFRATALGPLLVLWASLMTLGGRSASASAPEMLFTRLGSDDGMSYGAVTSIVQDARGFVWLGTEDGLDRFDGYELRHFIHRRDEPGSLPNNWISALAKDPAGRLWVGSDGGGVVLRDEANGQFQAAAHDGGDKIRALYFDRAGRLWIATRDGGVERVDPDSHAVTRFRHDVDDSNSISSDSVFAITEDAAGHLWIGTAAGLDRLDPSSGRIERLGSRLRAALEAAGAPVPAAADVGVKVNAAITDDEGHVWIALDAGVARVDATAATVEVLRHRVGEPDSLPAGRVTSLLEDSDHRFWVGTSAGLALLDRRTDRAVTFQRDATNPASLPDGNITSLYQDRSGLLWVGTKTGGVARWNPRSWSFGLHRLGAAGGDGVTSFAMDRNGRLWIGSFGAGASSIDPASGAVVRYTSKAGATPGLRDDTIMAVVTDDQDRVWLGTMGHGIERLNAARTEVTHFDQDARNPDSLPAAGVMSLLTDQRGRIWVGTYGGGLARIDPRDDRVIRYPHGSSNPQSLASDRATALAEDPSGLIWVGTDGGGLDVLDPVSGRFAHFVHDAHDPNSLAANTVYAVHVDEKGAVWVGTRGGGLDRVSGVPFSGRPVRFDNLSENEGLPDSTVYGIETDAAGRLWISTNVGLAVVQPGDRSVRSFRRTHGLQGDEFNFGAHYRAPDGTIYFGGANGYNGFRPERLQVNDTAPPVVFTDILKLGNRVSPTPEAVRDLKLGYRDTIVTFHFAALDFSGPAENRYAYQLVGFDSDWVNAGSTRQATYMNLTGGDYQFRVRASNNDGRWSETPLTLNLHVTPPPWATWWARLVYVLGAAAALYLVWRGQQRRIERESNYARRLKEEVDSRTAELAERNRDMARANLQLQEASVSDSLTGLGNRRCLHDAMIRLKADARARFVLMIVDLDYLKPINDKYGHEAGDASLVQVAQILRREFRSQDLIVRWGGDEFVVLCAEADMTIASALAERVRSAVAKQIFRVANGQVVRTSCSIGFAQSPFVPGRPDLIDWEGSLGIADAALYESKRSRNNWVGFAGTEKAAELPSLKSALLLDSAALEAEGFIVARRRPWDPGDTVDMLRALNRPVTR